jgi:hypothetical protein
MKIYYTLNVPNYYMDFIKNLEQKYNIKMTGRELSILAMKPAKYEDNIYEKWMETKATIYIPNNLKIIEVN